MWKLATAFLLVAMPAFGELIRSDIVYMIDGDTASIGEARDRVRLVGFDTPETRNAQCSYEKALGDEATRRARELVKNAGAVDLVMLPGRDKYDRGLGRLYVGGKELGTILISEGLARPYDGGKRRSWCK
ncbi:thermonuclease family protein [Celeribacter naphthalenivorans]|uniref:thermonuclease family protein n=1 Tax=Celeribacter naphthalenivorans TaxID=1614694 RepID=UPI00384F7EDA